jgi:hypothetical protein
LRELNKRIKRKLFPILKINDLLQKVEGFYLASSLDLNMGYYHIGLTPYASSLCTVVLPGVNTSIWDCQWDYGIVQTFSRENE